MMTMRRPRFSMRCDCVVTSCASTIEFIRDDDSADSDDDDEEEQAEVFDEM